MFVLAQSTTRYIKFSSPMIESPKKDPSYPKAPEGGRKKALFVILDTRKISINLFFEGEGVGEGLWSPYPTV